MIVIDICHQFSTPRKWYEYSFWFLHLCRVWFLPHFMLHELGHTKTGPKIFVVVIPEESLAGTSLVKCSFGMIPIITYNLWRVQSTILQSMSYQKKAGFGWCSQAFFWHDNNNDKKHKTCFCVTWLVCSHAVTFLSPSCSEFRIEITSIKYYIVESRATSQKFNQANQRTCCEVMAI